MSTTRRRMTGTVISNKMQKTIVVRIERLARHAMYDRVMRLAKKFKVHDEMQTARPGDLVEIEETRPMSREKRWCLVSVVRRAPEAIQGDVAEPESQPTHKTVRPKAQEPVPTTPAGGQA